MMRDLEMLKLDEICLGMMGCRSSSIDVEELLRSRSGWAYVLFSAIFLWYMLI